MTTPLEPLRFRRHFVEKVWGGRALEASPGIELPPGQPIGETWEVVDRAAENSVVDGGAFDGTTLGELIRTRADEILGSARPNQAGRFPLLVKYLDAQAHLSVQVHPDDATAAALGGDAEAKTEAWYVVEATPEGCVWAGVKAGVARAAFEAAAPTDGIVDLLERYPVQRGDCLLIRGGTVHAIGAGVTILEVQQNSDTTYRMYDWGRVGLDGKPRATHLAPALRCVRYDADARPTAPALPAPTGGLARANLATSHVFRMDALGVSEPVELDTEGAFRIYAVAEGAGTITAGSATRSLARGDVWLVPACCSAHRIAPEGGDLRLIEMTAG